MRIHSLYYENNHRIYIPKKLRLKSQLYEESVTIDYYGFFI